MVVGLGCTCFPLLKGTLCLKYSVYYNSICRQMLICILRSEADATRPHNPHLLFCHIALSHLSLLSLLLSFLL
jgi:hypothetical protein